MNCLWRPVGMADARVLRSAAVHHRHRHSLCQTAFQDGRTVARAIREGRRTTYIKDNGNIQGRYIRRPTGIDFVFLLLARHSPNEFGSLLLLRSSVGRFLCHVVPAMQDDAPHPGAGEESVG